MRIAISACADGWKERVDDRFGRAEGFFVCDTDTNETTYIDNHENVDVAHGAGTSAAQSIVNAGVRVVITGRVGPKAGSVLRAAGVRVMTGDDLTTVEEVYQRFRDGELYELSV
ncbi:MAG: NifB/NifX family molybdenum-iron cluster-binding protein [Candidatus Latescibacterota bacterium]|nr:MAG: NifB/NifX family molybdenum-iron cluster-binding protein [Candidatus Latescibacterota bacterium]